MKKRTVEKTGPPHEQTRNETEVILQNIRNFCSYQERYESEVEQKLKKWMVGDNKIPAIISQLKEEKFLDESRYARVYAGGKLRSRKWGKKKIGFELRIKGIPEQTVQEGLASIDDQEYHEILVGLILQKKKEIKGSKNLNSRQKIINFVLHKGFELDLILDIINPLKF